MRVSPMRRYEADRDQRVFASSVGPVRVKVRRMPGAFRAVPEYDDVAALAASLGRPALEIQRTLEAELHAAGDELALPPPPPASSVE